MAIICISFLQVARLVSFFTSPPSIQVAWLVADRVNDIKRYIQTCLNIISSQSLIRKFDVALDLGCRRGHVGKYIDTVRA